MVVLLYGALIVCAAILSAMVIAIFARFIRGISMRLIDLIIVLLGIALIYRASQWLINQLESITHSSASGKVFAAAVVIMVVSMIVDMFKPKIQDSGPTGDRDEVDLPKKTSFLTYPVHYEQTSAKAPGKTRSLTLINAEEDGPMVHLAYQWEDNLSHKEADDLDTQLRAYIACAIYDAGTSAGLRCAPGQLHGERPAWHINRERIPVSLVNADFDVRSKTCNLYVGHGLMIAGSLEDYAVWGKKLVQGFKARFSNITV